MKRIEMLRKAYCENLKGLSPIFGCQDFSKVIFDDYEEYGFARAITNELTIDAYELAKEFIPEKYWDLFDNHEFTYEIESKEACCYGALRFPDYDEDYEGKYLFNGLDFLYYSGRDSIKHIGHAVLGDREETASYKEFVEEIDDFKRCFINMRHSLKDFVDKNYYRIFKFEL